MTVGEFEAAGDASDRLSAAGFDHHPLAALIGLLEF